MKNFIYKLLLFAVTPVFFFSCEDDRDLTTLNPNTTIEVSLSNSSVVLDPSMPDAEALVITWPQPDFGFAAAPNYTIMMDNSGGDFSEGVSINVGSALEQSLTVSRLNSYLLNLGFEQDMPGDVDIMVIAELGDFHGISSSTVTLNATAYEDLLDLSTPWGIVGSGYNDWGNAGPDAPFYQTAEVGVIVSYVTLVDGEIKFRENNDWTLNYGDDGNDGTLDEGGTNIAVTAGMYKIEMNLNTLTYTIEPYTWGIVGSAYNDWGNAGPDFAFEYDPYSDQWRAVVELMDGEMKIRQNNDWTLNYGDSGADGTLDLGGDNIVVTAGIYIITANFEELTYTIEEIDYIWGVVGSAYNDWGNAGPDAAFTRDWSTNDEAWILRNVTLLDGEWKIRGNNDWVVNYGDDGADGTMEVGGANIMATAGTYTIRLNFANPDTPTYTIE
ncbi:hypothetical protein KH5_11430 [Urechidicola sp. KH5]